MDAEPSFRALRLGLAEADSWESLKEAYWEVRVAEQRLKQVELTDLREQRKLVENELTRALWGEDT